MEKLSEMSHNLDSQNQWDQDEFENKIFHAGTFSEIQKYLKSICRGTQLPSEMYLEDKKATTDKEKTDLFINFFQLIFTTSDYQKKIDKEN